MGFVYSLILKETGSFDRSYKVNTWMIMQGILQSQGRLLRKMRFMPSSLSSKSHRLLTALVDSRHKKVYKVKNCITDIDPEREKEEKEKVFKEWMLLSLLILPCFAWVVSCPSVILLRKKKKKNLSVYHLCFISLV